MVIHSLLQNKKDFKELVSNLFFKIDDLGLGMITISEFEKHFNDESLLHLLRAMLFRGRVVVSRNFPPG